MGEYYSFLSFENDNALLLLCDLWISHILIAFLFGSLVVGVSIFCLVHFVLKHKQK